MKFLSGHFDRHLSKYSLGFGIIVTLLLVTIIGLTFSAGPSNQQVQRFTVTPMQSSLSFKTESVPEPEYPKTVDGLIGAFLMCDDLGYTTQMVLSQMIGGHKATFGTPAVYPNKPGCIFTGMDGFDQTKFQFVGQVTEPRIDAGFKEDSLVIHNIFRITIETCQEELVDVYVVPTVRVPNTSAILYASAFGVNGDADMINALPQIYQYTGAYFCNTPELQREAKGNFLLPVKLN